MKEKIIILLIISLLFSCEKNANIKFKETKLMVINSFFTPDSLFKINISESLPISDSQNVNFIENASAQLFENEIFIGNLNYIGQGNYSINYKPLVKKEYKIKVSSPQGYNCEAINTIPQKTKITSVDTLTDITKPYELICKINFKDNDSTQNYYFFEVRTIAGSYTFEYPVGNIDTVFYEESINFEYNDNTIEYKIAKDNLNYGVVFSDELINGKQKQLTITIAKSSIANIRNNPIKFYLKTISKDYYLYAKSYGKLLNQEADFLAEPIQIYSNISNGFGIFGGYNQSVDSIIYNKK